MHWGEWVKVHGDDHYCTAIFHYLKEYNICFRKCAMTSTDDKNKIKVSEPNYPISAINKEEKSPCCTC